MVELFSTDDIVCSISSSFTGIHRAERLMYQFFEEKNHSKMVIRLGCSDHGTCHTEKLLLINSYVKSLGDPVDKTPFKDVSAPTRRSEKEYMGFSYCLPTSVHEVSNPTEGAARDSTERRIVDDDDENHDGTSEDEPDDDFLARVLGDDNDIEVLLNEDDLQAPSPEENREVQQQVRQLDAAAEALEEDRLHQAQIRSELARLLPDTDGRESTLQAFHRLTQNQPWFPFRMPGSTTPETEVDKEEATLFDEWSDRYSIEVDTGTRSYHSFARAWNNEVSNRFKAWSQGNDAIVQIRPNTRELLVTYFKKKRDMESLAATAPTEDNDRQVVTETLRDSRHTLPNPPPAVTCAPPMYRPTNANAVMPFGHPTTMNATIAMNAVAAFHPAFVQGIPFAMTSPYAMSLVPTQQAPAPT